MFLKASYTLSAKWVSRIVLPHNFTRAKKKKGRRSCILPFGLFAGDAFESNSFEILPKQLVPEEATPANPPAGPNCVSSLAAARLGG
jgi:hypothetical protein